MSEGSDDGEDEDKDRAKRVRDRRSRRDRDSRGRDSDTENEDQTSSTSQTSQTKQTETKSQIDKTSQTEQREQNGQTEATEQRSSVDGTSQMSQTQSDTTDERSLDEQPIKERTHETFYLRDDLRRELRRISGQASLDFEMKFDTELEKNRHLRPLLLHLGAKQLEDMDPEAIKSVLNDTDLLDSVEIND